MRPSQDHDPASDTTVQENLGNNPGEADSNKRMSFSSRELAWPGVLVEGGTAVNWGVRDVPMPFVYLGLNAGTEASISTGGEGRRTTRDVMEPGALWIHPSDVPMTRLCHGNVRFVHALFDPALIAHLSGHEKPISAGIGIDEPQLAHLVRALGEEVRLQNPNGKSFERMLTTVIAGYLARRFSATPMRVGVERLTPAQHKRALDFIEDRLDVGASIEEIAGHLGLSPFHFARAFRNAVGMSPHAFLIERRLQRAREGIVGGRLSISDAAAQFGFSDGSHFSRLFRRRYGELPSALARRRKRR